MKTFVNHHPQEQKDVNVYFQSRLSKWKNIYANDGVRGEIYRARQATVLNWIDDLGFEPNSQMLEVGCGAGFLSMALAQRGFRLHAIDAVEDMVELASEHAMAAQLTHLLSVGLGDVHGLAFEDSTFDLVVALGVIPWVERPERGLARDSPGDQARGVCSADNGQPGGVDQLARPSASSPVQASQAGHQQSVQSGWTLL